MKIKKILVLNNPGCLVWKKKGERSRLLIYRHTIWDYLDKRSGNIIKTIHTVRFPTLGKKYRWVNKMGHKQKNITRIFRKIKKLIPDYEAKGFSGHMTSGWYCDGRMICSIIN